MAKKGSTLDFIEDVGVPVADVKSEIDKKIRECWDTMWTRYSHARQTKFFYATQDKAKGKSVMAFSRLQLGRYIRIISGTNNLLYHRSNIDPDINPMCRLCREVQESFIHLITECPALWSEQNAFRGNCGEIEDGATNYKPEHILDFSYLERVNSPLQRPEEEHMSTGSSGDSEPNVTPQEDEDVDMESGSDESNEWKTRQ